MTKSVLWLSVTGFIIDMILLEIHRRQKLNRYLQGRSFYLVLAATALMNFVALLYSVLLQNFREMAFAEAVISWLETIITVILPYLILYYLTTVLYDSSRRRNRERIITWTTFANLILVVVLGPLVICRSRIVVLNPNRGRLLFTITSVLFVTGVAIIYYTLRKTILSRHWKALAAVTFFIILADILFIWYGNLSGYGFLLTCVLVFCMYTLQGRGVLEDLQSGVGSAYSAASMITSKMELNHHFCMMVICFHRLSSILPSLSSEESDRLFAQIVQILEDITPLPKYRLRENVFMILQSEMNERWIQEVMIALRSRFSAGVRLNGNVIQPGMWACTVRVPKHVQTLAGFDQAIDLLERYSDGRICSEVPFEKLDLEGEAQTQQQAKELSRALLENRLEVWYQPIVSTKTDRVESAEALIRMRDEAGGYVRPDFFIPAAEKSGMIVRVGEVVMQEVCRFLSGPDWEKLGLHYVEINLSVNECMRQDLPEKVHSVMQKYHVPARCLNIEITESADASASQIMINNVQKIHDEQGIRFSLDDFGTGFSNMTRILKMPVDLIKFDRSLLLNADASRTGRRVFRASAEMAHAIGRKIVSEGVETEEQKEFVKSMGIDYIQGFYYSRPLPEKEFITFVKEFNAGNLRNEVKRA